MEMQGKGEEEAMTTQASASSGSPVLSPPRAKETRLDDTPPPLASLQDDTGLGGLTFDDGDDDDDDYEDGGGGGDFGDNAAHGSQVGVDVGSMLGSAMSGGAPNLRKRVSSVNGPDEFADAVDVSPNAQFYQHQAQQQQQQRQRHGRGNRGRESDFYITVEPASTSYGTDGSGSSNRSSGRSDTPSSAHAANAAAAEGSAYPPRKDHERVPLLSTPGGLDSDPSVSKSNTAGGDDERQGFWQTLYLGCLKRDRKALLSLLQSLLLVLVLVLAIVPFAMMTEIDESGHLYTVSDGQQTLIDLSSSRTVVDVEFRTVANGTGNLTVTIWDEDGVADDRTVMLSESNGVDNIVLRFDLAARPHQLGLEGTGSGTIPVLLFLRYSPELIKYEVIFAAAILIFVYVLIIFELIHRALAAMLGSFIALGVLSVLGKQPPLEVIVGWIDYETVMLLFGMMVIVGIFSDTGVFEWAAVKAYRLSRGHTWRLLTYLCIISAIVSAFLDNVTTILLLTPVTIRICEVIGLDPVPVLLAEVFFSNIGGTATAVGDPPNVIIVSSNWETDREKDIQFAEFTGHMFLGIIFVSVASFFCLKFMFRNEPLDNPDPPRVAELKREIDIWKRTQRKLHGTEDERTVAQQLQTKIEECNRAMEDALANVQQTWEEKVAEMERQSPIKSRELLWNSSTVLGIVIILFFVHSVPSVHLGLGWIAILGAICLLLLTGAHDLDELLERIEWGTLLFFAALFILMEALAELRLIDFIGEQTSLLIEQLPADSRLAVSIILVLWISALASSFIDNIPFTTAMIPVIKSIAADEKIDLPLRPLVWALAFGACLGGNGTLIGASANVVCAGLAERV
ncbi:P protein, partial [Salpingoeca rosetta]